MALILDTGPIFAALDRRDAHYIACRRLIENSQEDLIIPAPVLPEVDYFLSMRARRDSQLFFLDSILSGAYRVEDLTLDDYRRVRQLCERYADFDIGFVDAAVLAIVERLDEPKLATLDHRHFSVMRPRHIDTLQLLPS